MKTRTFFTTILLGFICISQAQTWTKLGNVQFSRSNVDEPHIAIAPNGTPYVIFKESGTYAYKATVVKFENGTWGNVGLTSFSFSDIYQPRIVVDNNGTPYAAFMQNKGDGWKAWVMKYDNTNWVDVGSVAVSEGEVSFLNIACDKNNTIYVAYRDHSLAYKACVKKFNGTSWDYVGSSAFSAYAAQYLDLNIDDNNNVYVAYREEGGSWKASIMKYNSSNSTWEYVGGQAPTDVVAGASGSLALTNYSNSVPSLLYLKNNEGFKASVIKFDGTQWSNVNESQNFISQGEVSYADMAGVGNYLYATFREHSLGYKGYVKRFDGSSWSDIGTQPFYNGVVNSNNIAIDKTGKIIYVAACDESNGNVGAVWAYNDQSITTIVQSLIQDLKITQQGDKIILQNLKNGKLTIHTIDGKLIKTDKILEDSYSVKLNRGVYIIRVDGQSHKILI